MKRLVFLIPVLAFAVMAIWFAQGLDRDPRYIPSMLINQPAPEFSLQPIDGRDEAFASRDLKGEVSMVNIFGSWCASCEIEHPVLMSIAGEGVAPIYGLDWKDRPGAGAQWLMARGDPYAKIGDDAEGRVAIDFGVTGAPETFVVDKEGRVRHKHVGPISEDDWRNVLKPMIEDLKSAPPSY
ncbi:MAG: DsbE family thiol:disulfide interchange protein [Parvularculaceae bacterium]|nr:DsbE family thiol:disulfide interchange protein [Parvularculaceae bacterium]